MNRLENLPEITAKALGGLSADEALRCRILNQARSGNASPEKRSFLRPALSLAAAAAALALVLFLLNGTETLPEPEPVLRHLSAGGAVVQAALLPESLKADAVESVALLPGTPADANKKDALLQTLRQAEPVNAQVSQWSRQLMIREKDGTTHIWEAEPPYLTDGAVVWSCPAFFELAD